jgi:site-specific DNA-methyltransferase (adenine-specific)
LTKSGEARPVTGRFPANVMHDGSDEVLAGFPDTHSAGVARTAAEGTHSGKSGMFGLGAPAMRFGDAGSAARFFYCAKASKSDRNEGCEGLPTAIAGQRSDHSGQHITRRDEAYQPPLVANIHPTVKPTPLMRYLCRLVTPLRGVVLDPFAGSGSTGKAAILEGFHPVLCEMTPEYIPIIEARLRHALTMRSIGDNDEA